MSRKKSRANLSHSGAEWGAKWKSPATLEFVLAQGLVATLAAVALVPSGANVAPPSRPGAWKQIGKVETSRFGRKLHVSRTAVNMTALAFVVTSRSPRRIQVAWDSYCEFESDDDYTEDHTGKASGVGRITVYPPVFDGATLCDVSVNTAAINGGKATVAVFSY
jgi:hypothetical protein